MTKKVRITNPNKNDGKEHERKAVMCSPEVHGKLLDIARRERMSMNDVIEKLLELAE